MRIFVPQLVQREVTRLRHRHRFIQQPARIQPCYTLAFAQIAFAIGLEIPTGFGNGQTETNGGHRILQTATLARVQVNIATGNEWDIQVAAYPFEGAETLTIGAIA